MTSQIDYPELSPSSGKSKPMEARWPHMDFENVPIKGRIPKPFVELDWQRKERLRKEKLKAQEEKAKAGIDVMEDLITMGGTVYEDAYEELKALEMAETIEGDCELPETRPPQIITQSDIFPPVEDIEARIIAGTVGDGDYPEEGVGMDEDSPKNSPKQAVVERKRSVQPMTRLDQPGYVIHVDVAPQDPKTLVIKQVMQASLPAFIAIGTEVVKRAVAYVAQQAVRREVDSRPNATQESAPKERKTTFKPEKIKFTMKEIKSAERGPWTEMSNGEKLEFHLDVLKIKDPAERKKALQWFIEQRRANDAILETVEGKIAVSRATTIISFLLNNRIKQDLPGKNTSGFINYPLTTNELIDNFRHIIENKTLVPEIEGCVLKWYETRALPLVKFYTTAIYPTFNKLNRAFRVSTETATSNETRDQAREIYNEHWSTSLTSGVRDFIEQWNVVVGEFTDMYSKTWIETKIKAIESGIEREKKRQTPVSTKDVNLERPVRELVPRPVGGASKCTPALFDVRAPIEKFKHEKKATSLAPKEFGTVVLRPAKNRNQTRRDAWKIHLNNNAITRQKIIDPIAFGLLHYSMLTSESLFEIMKSMFENSDFKIPLEHMNIGTRTAMPKFCNLVHYPLRMSTECPNGTQCPAFRAYATSLVTGKPTKEKCAYMHTGKPFIVEDTMIAQCAWNYCGDVNGPHWHDDPTAYNAKRVQVYHCYEPSQACPYGTTRLVCLGNLQNGCDLVHSLPGTAFIEAITRAFLVMNGVTMWDQMLINQIAYAIAGYKNPILNMEYLKNLGIPDAKPYNHKH